MSLNLLANSAVQMLSIHDPECMGSGKARKLGFTWLYIPEDLFLYISAQISVFQDKMWFDAGTWWNYFNS